MVSTRLKYPLNEIREHQVDHTDIFARFASCVPDFDRLAMKLLACTVCQLKCQTLR